MLVGSNSGEGILNSGKYILQPDLLTQEFQDPEYWDEEMGPFFIFDRCLDNVKEQAGAELSQAQASWNCFVHVYVSIIKVVGLYYLYWILLVGCWHSFSSIQTFRLG